VGHDFLVEVIFKLHNLYLVERRSSNRCSFVVKCMNSVVRSGLAKEDVVVGSGKFLSTIFGTRNEF
jgi:hypothetical protein